MNFMNDSKTGYPSIDKPWLKYYAHEIIRDNVPDVTIYDFLYLNNNAYQDSIAIKYLGSNIKYKVVFEKIEQCAKALVAIGCKKGDIITIAMPSMPEAVYAIYACSYLGLVANIIHPLASQSEIIFYLNEVKSEVIIMFSGTYELVKKSLDKTFVKTAIVVSPVESAPIFIKSIYRLKNKAKYEDCVINWKTFISNGKNTQLPAKNINSSEPVVISHTGGTTGEPKGVVLSNNNLVSEVWQIGSTMKGGRGTTMLTVLPPFVNYSLTNCILEPLSLGISIVLIPNYEPERICEYIKKYKPEHINSIPPYWEALINLEEAKNMDFSFIINAFYGGEKMADENVEKVNALLSKGGARISLMSGYGMTELVSAATATYADCCSKGSAGIPLVKVECKIVDTDDGKEKQYGEEGEICFSGPTLMLGYYKNDEATNEIIKIHEDGTRWLHTGDIGYIDKAGEIFITGRIKRIFITKGEDGIATKMFPDRVEKVLMENVSIEECCVVNKEDEVRVNVAIAFVKMKKGKSIDVERESIIEHLEKRLPSYMIPVSIIEIDEIPRTTRGKTDYRKVKEMFL